MNEKLAEALSHVDEKYVAAAGKKRMNRKNFLGLAAAVLAVVMLVNVPTIPFVITARAVALASESRIPERPIQNGLISDEAFDKIRDAYWAAYDKQEIASQNAMTAMTDFFRTGSEQFLTGSDENRIWSPVNAAIALSVLAETAAGSTRQEILDLLGTADVETLREYVSGLWEMAYMDDGKEICVLANSLWLDDTLEYDQTVMDTLAHDYFASVYQGDLGSALTNNAIQSWVNNQTGGFLKQPAKGIDVTPNHPDVETALALASTVYLQAQWYNEFDPSLTTQGIFHASGGDREVTYMNMEEMQDNYYWGESFGAVSLNMKNGTRMWLILPDEDKTVSDVLAEGEYLDLLGSAYSYENSKDMKINLTLPKFDITTTLDLKEGLEAMGVTEAFRLYADFGTTFDVDEPVFVNRINQATRVSIDEEGVTAASYIILDWGVGAMAPAEEVIDFVLDRPFLFVIASAEGIPIFVGTVNEP